MIQIGIYGEACYEKEESAEKFNNILDSDWSRNIFATIGAVTAQDYKLNLWLWIGFLTIIAGIVYHLVMVKCPYCGHSLVGYRPFPKECPKCHKKFEFEN